MPGKDNGKPRRTAVCRKRLDARCKFGEDLVPDASAIENKLRGN